MGGGGWVGGGVAGSLESKANSAQALLELGLRLSLAKTVVNGVHSVVNENISEPRVKQTIDHVYNQNLLCLFSDL